MRMNLYGLGSLGINIAKMEMTLIEYIREVMLPSCGKALWKFGYLKKVCGLCGGRWVQNSILAACLGWFSALAEYGNEVHPSKCTERKHCRLLGSSKRMEMG